MPAAIDRTLSFRDLSTTLEEGYIFPGALIALSVPEAENRHSFAMVCDVQTVAIAEWTTLRDNVVTTGEITNNIEIVAAFFIPWEVRKLRLTIWVYANPPLSLRVLIHPWEIPTEPQRIGFWPVGNPTLTHRRAVQKALEQMKTETTEPIP